MNTAPKIMLEDAMESAGEGRYDGVEISKIRGEVLLLCALLCCIHPNRHIPHTNKTAEPLILIGITPPGGRYKGLESAKRMRV